MALGRSKVLLITRLKDMANQGQPSDQADRNVQDDTHVMIGPSLSIVRRQPWMWKFSCACHCLCSVTVFALVPVVVFALSLSIYCLTYRETSLDMEHTCKKRGIAGIYPRNFFWIFRKVLG